MDSNILLLVFALHVILVDSDWIDGISFGTLWVCFGCCCSCDVLWLVLYGEK